MSDIRVKRIGESYRWKCPGCFREQVRGGLTDAPSYREITHIKNDPYCRRCKRRGKHTEDTQ